MAEEKANKETKKTKSTKTNKTKKTSPRVKQDTTKVSNNISGESQNTKKTTKGKHTSKSKKKPGAASKQNKSKVSSRSNRNSDNKKSKSGNSKSKTAVKNKSATKSENKKPNKKSEKSNNIKVVSSKPKQENKKPESKARQKETISKKENKKRSGGNKGKLFIGLFIILCIIFGAFLGYRAVHEKTFPKNVKLNEADVSGKDIKGTIKILSKRWNEVQISEGDKRGIAVKTDFSYDCENNIKRMIMLSRIDPRTLFGLHVKYTMGLDVVDGIEETATVLRKSIPAMNGTIYTKDAYIDYDNMKIIKEVQGNSLDYVKISKKIAEMKKEKPAKTSFHYEHDLYIAEPKIKESDLKDNLDFAKKWLAGGMKISTEDGLEFNISAKSLSNVIIYKGRGKDPEYSLTGAKKIANDMSKSYNMGTVTINTLSGSRNLINYELDSNIDVDKTAKSIVSAAKKKKTATLYTKSNEAGNLNTRIEINISAQKVNLIENGKSIFETPCVTGGGNFATPTGIYRLDYKCMNVTLKGDNGDGTKYASPVTYWMPFTGGIGLHDASWRGTFGGNIYTYSGSHGCVNLPYYAAQTIYGKVDSGTPIIVYQ